MKGHAFLKVVFVIFLLTYCVSGLWYETFKNIFEMFIFWLLILFIPFFMVSVILIFEEIKQQGF